MGEKKVKGRKRHIGVDTQGHLLHIQVTRANRHDGNVGIEVFEALVEKYETLQRFSADQGYQGMASDYAEILLKRPVDIPKHRQGQFEVLPKRWVVERNFAWMLHSRRLSKDYEILPRHSENMVRIDSLRRVLANLNS